MSLEHPPGTEAATESVDHSTPSDPGFWHSLIREGEAADFLGLSDRTLQGFRQDGGGPRFVRISSRCIRYKRAWLQEWAEAKAASSTSEYGAGHE